MLCLLLAKPCNSGTIPLSLQEVQLTSTHIRSRYTKIPMVRLLTFQVTSSMLLYFREILGYIYKSDCALLQHSWLEYKR